MNIALRKSPEPEEKPRRRWKRWLALLALLLATWLSYRAYAGHRNLSTVQAIQGKMNDPNLTSDQRQKLFQDMRVAMNSLTPAQRELLSNDRQKRREAEMSRYFAMNKADQKKYLDERLNSMQKMMTGGAGGMSPAGPRPGTTTPTSVKGPTSSSGFGSGKSMSPDDIEARKKKMLDNTTPDLRAMMDRFRKDLEKRAKERGMTLPSGQPGGRR